MKSGFLQSSKALIECEQLDTWHEYLRRYPEAVRLVSIARKKEELINHDNWLWKEYPDVVKKRSPQSISKDELTRIMSWKLLRGKNRPTLLGLIRQNEESTVLAVTTQALRSLQTGEWQEALNKLTELRGVGPATASAILSPLAPESVPFMADEVLESCLSNFRDYNLKSYINMRNRVASISSTLSSLEEQHSSFWTMENVGKAIWTAAMISLHSSITFELINQESSLSGKKRTREEGSETTTTTTSSSSSSLVDNSSVELSAEKIIQKDENEEKETDEPPPPQQEMKRTLSGRIRKSVVKDLKS